MSPPSDCRAHLAVTVHGDDDHLLATCIRREGGAVEAMLHDAGIDLSVL